jgi:hypothetical protein
MNDQLRKLGIIAMCGTVCLYVFTSLPVCDSQGKSIDTLVCRSKNGLMMCEKIILTYSKSQEGGEICISSKFITFLVRHILSGGWNERVARMDEIAS